jgi:hypothetical protein
MVMAFGNSKMNLLQTHGLRVEESGDGYVVFQERGISKDAYPSGVRCHSVDDLQDPGGVCRSLERSCGICMYRLQIYLRLLFKALCQTLQRDETPMKGMKLLCLPNSFALYDV